MRMKEYKVSIQFDTIFLSKMWKIVELIFFPNDNRHKAQTYVVKLVQSKEELNK